MKKLILSLVCTLALTAASWAHCGECTASADHEHTHKSIVSVADEAGQFETLLAAAKAAGLVDTLNGPGPYTVFAPTDEAFAKLPEGTVESLLKDPETLSQILLYHVVPGSLKASDVVTKTSLDTAQGAPLALTVKDGTVMVNDAKVVSTDIEASNGIIHVIDTVILPPKESANK